jgi:citrate synthase
MTDNSDWTTAIAEVRAGDVLVRGYPLSDLIGRVTFAEMAHLVMLGELPPPGKARMLDAIFVTLIEHGISPSTMIVRMLASCGTPVQAGLAGGVLSIADYHGGAGERLGQLIDEVVREAGGDEPSTRDSLRRHVAEHRARNEPLEGFGHPQHPDGDPRSHLLIGLAGELDVAGPHVRALEILAEELSAALQRPMHANINGALAVIFLDLGFPWRAFRGLVVGPRTLGLTAHYLEEVEQRGRWRHAASNRVEYTGPAERSLSEPTD